MPPHTLLSGLHMKAEMKQMHIQKAFQSFRLNYNHYYLSDTPLKDLHWGGVVRCLVTF